MRSLYIKQKVFSWVDHFSVFDEFQNEIYTAESPFLTFGKKLILRTAAGDEVAVLQQKVLSLMPKFHILVNGQPVAEIAKKFTMFRSRYEIGGLGWEVQGDLMSHNYEIRFGEVPIASIHKQWLTWGDTYAIDIMNPKDEVNVIAVVLAIDAVLAMQQESASASASSSNN